MDPNRICLEAANYRKRTSTMNREGAMKRSNINSIKNVKISILLSSTTFERWKSVRTSSNVRTHNEVAVMLLDIWDLHQKLLNPTHEMMQNVQTALYSQNVQSMSRQADGINNVPQSTLRLLRDIVGKRTVCEDDTLVRTVCDDRMLVKQEYIEEQHDVQRREHNTKSTSSQSTQFYGEVDRPIDHCDLSETHVPVVEVKTEVVNDYTSSATESAAEDNDVGDNNEAMLDDNNDKDECTSDDMSETLWANIKDVVFDKSDKVLPVTEENLGGEASGSAVRSTRIKSKGFRPNYAALEWGESSGNDESDSDDDDDDDTDDEMSESEDKTGEVLCNEHSNATPGESKTVIKKERTESYEKSKSVTLPKKKKRRESKGKQGNCIRRKSDSSDSDYIPYDEKVAKRKKKHSDTDTDSSSEENDAEGDSNQGDSTKRRTYKKRKVPVTKSGTGTMRKKVTAKKKWITINLEDHSDKYCVEDVESFERQHRRSDVVVKSFSCLVCKRFKCAEKTIISTHIEEHVNKVLECTYCDFIGSYRRELENHQQEYGHLKATFVCDICGLSCNSLSKRRHHRGTVHNIPEHKCRLCKEMFVTKALKFEHMRSVHPDSCQYCPTCKKCRFTLSPEKFEEHLKNCKSIVQCQICGKELSRNSLNFHIRRLHSNIRKHPCEFCKYNAKSKRSLVRHMMTHNDELPYSCEQCAFRCRQLTQLTSHMRTHTGEKPFKCTQCKYAAAWNVQLKDHIKIHDMETAVMCKQCDVLFKSNMALKLHAKKAH